MPERATWQAGVAVGLKSKSKQSKALRVPLPGFTPYTYTRPASTPLRWLGNEAPGLHIWARVSPNIHTYCTAQKVVHEANAGEYNV